MTPPLQSGLIVHPDSTNDAGSRAAVEAPVRRPDGTWNIQLTVAVFRPWRGSQATIASDPTFNAAPQSARPHRCLHGEFRPAIAGCRCREPLPPRLARPNLLLQKTGADGRDRTDDLRFTKPLLYQLSYIGLKSLRRIMPCAAPPSKSFSLRTRQSPLQGSPDRRELAGINFP